MNNWYKQNGIHLAIGALFFVLCFIYFTPAFQGKTLGQNDVSRAQATQKEIMDYRAKDTTILWTNQIFGGMPTFQIWTPYPNNITSHVISAIKAVFPAPVDTVLLLLFGAYLLFIVLGLNPWLSAAGAIGYTLSSYNLILMVAGHANQVFAIAFFAPILAGIILTLRGKYLLGAALTAFFLAMEVRANHIQMTYYLMIALLIYIGIELFHAIKNKTTGNFLKALGYLAVATLLAVAVNASMLWSTYVYSKATIRGNSNLSSKTSKAPATGLDRDYAYEYSQGVGECITFLIPNAYGGGSRTLVSDDSRVAKVLTDKGVDATQAMGFAQQLPMYWGEKPFTEGPYYFGAGVFFLFILGLIIVKDRIKWWLLSVVLLTMLLSFGKNFPFVSDLFFHYFPMYNKFRAVDSILAVAQLCFPILAFLALNEIINAKDKAPYLKKAYIALGITGGIALIMALFPEALLSFKASTHQTLIDQLTNQVFRGDSGMANDVARALVQDRAALARADALRSLLFVVLAFGLVWAFIKQKASVIILSIAFVALILVDMWGIGKRYLKTESFVDKADIEQPKPRDVDQFIMRDTDPDFRVFDMTQGITFDAVTPNFYKSVGGYSAARLKRFDELINSQFNKSINQDVLDMLNTKYIITSDPKTQALTMHANTTACGHAWFVKSIKFAKNADAEMEAISAFDPKEEAIVDESFSKVINEHQTSLDTMGSIKLVSYSPDHLVYQTGSVTQQVAVFSEIYYEDGWKMLIDGEEKPYFRADYVLRAAQIPVGNHKVEFIFHPVSYYGGEKISLAGSILLVIALALAIYTEFKKKKVAEPNKK